MRRAPETKTVYPHRAGRGQPTREGSRSTEQGQTSGQRAGSSSQQRNRPSAHRATDFSESKDLVMKRIIKIKDCISIWKYSEWTERLQRWCCWSDGAQTGVGITAAGRLMHTRMALPDTEGF